MVALAVFFLSGAAGLLYEVCWIKRASLGFGSTIYALSTVLAVFFLGLAAGNALFGRVSVRARHPLRVYALLELALAVLALLSLPAFDLAERIFGQVYQVAGGGGGAPVLARVAMAAVVLFPPTLLMGGTLPLFCRVFVRSGAAVATPVGLLYAANTLGAAAGCSAAGLALIPGIGVRATIALGAAIDLVCAAVAWRLRLDPAPEPPLGQEETPVPHEQEPAAGTPRRRPPGTAPEAPAERGEAAAVLGLVFMTGLIALGNEVLWARFLGLLVRNTVLTYTLMLTTVLLGIVLGSLLGSSVGDRVQSRARLFGALLAAGALAVLGTILLPPRTWHALRGGIWAYGLLMLPAAVLSGAAFPLAARMVVSRASLAGLRVGRMTAINTLGGIAGSLAMGFGLLPALGLQQSALILTGLGVAAGCGAWLALDRPARMAWRVAVTVVVVGAWLLISRASGVRLPADYLTDGRELLGLREGLQANLAVVRDAGIKTLEIDHLWQGQDVASQQVVAGHLPLLLHPHPRRVLVVGVGAGQTPAAMTRYDVERIDCVDIEPAVFDLIRAHFDSRWLADPRVHALIEDGRNYVAHSGRTYDVISLEVGQPFRPGVGAFYTVEFYRQARRRLAAGGLLSHLVPLASLPVNSLRRVVATFLEAFPQATVWYNSSDLLLIGTNAARFEIPAARLRLLSEDARVRDGLRYSHWGGPPMWLNRAPVLLGSFLIGPRGLADLARGAAPFHDDRPALEYATRNVSSEQRSELAALPLLEQHLEDVAEVLGPGFPPESLEAVPRIRRGNLGQLVSGVILRDVTPTFRRGGYPAVEALADSALRLSPGNPRAHRLMGDVLADQGHTAEAMRHYEIAIGLRPDYAAAHRSLGILLCEAERYAEAVTHLRACLSGYPNDDELRRFLAEAEAGLRRRATPPASGSATRPGGGGSTGP